MKIEFASATRIFTWTYAAIALPSWALLSSLPLFGLRMEDASVIERLGDLIFLLGGFLALAGLWIGAALIATPNNKAIVYGFLRGKVGLVTIYATIWMLAYWGFKTFIV